MLALASVGGVWLLSVALLMANVALTLLLGAVRPALLNPISSPARAASRQGLAKARLARAGAGAAAFAVVVGAGPLAFALTPAAPVDRKFSVALVQPGVIDNPTARTDASEALTNEHSHDGEIGGGKPNLIVWGESSIPNDLTGTTPADQAMLRRIAALSARDDAAVLVNQDTIAPGKGHEKWAVLVGPSGVEGTYAKTRLVPFGEYIPFRQQLGWLTDISQAAGSNMNPGNGAHTLTVASPSGSVPPVDIGILICFESAFPDMARVDTERGAQLIVYQSATSTFQGTWGPDQQASLAAVRAAETGRPVVQAALTGDSVAFDDRGRQLVWLDQDDRGAVTVSLSLPDQASKTFYDHAGDYVMWAGVGITGLSALIMLSLRRFFPCDNTGAPTDRAAEYDPDTGDPVRS